MNFRDRLKRNMRTQIVPIEDEIVPVENDFQPRCTDFREELKHRMRNRPTFVDPTPLEAKSGGSGRDCGPGMHKHSDAWGGKCHRIDQKHVRKQFGPNDTPNSQVKKTIKKLEIH